MPQPYDMTSLLMSVYDAHAQHSHKVIPTPVTRPVGELPQTTRTIFNAANTQLVAATNGTTILPPGTTVTISAQSDQFWINNDPSGTFARFVGLAAEVSRRMR